MPVSRDMLLRELKELQRLTAFEQAVATVRRVQATSTPVAQELAANAAKAGERLALLGQSVRSVGGAPDLVNPLLGRLGALVQAQVNQVQTLQAALLGDLVLEHQLRERARYARTLATTLGESSVVPVLDRLELAHTETIAWLETRLEEVARTGTSALRATPVQAAVGQVRRVAGAPFALAAESINRVGGLVQRLGRRAPELVEQAGETAAAAESSTAAAAQSTVEQVVDVAADTAGEVTQLAAGAATATAESAGDVADAVGEVASVAGGLASQAARTTGEAVSQVAQTAGQVTSQAADAAGRVTAQAVQGAGEVTSQTAEATGRVASQAVQSTGQVAAQAAEAAGQVAAQAADTVEEVSGAAAGGSATGAEQTRPSAEAASLAVTPGSGPAALLDSPQDAASGTTIDPDAVAAADTAADTTADLTAGGAGADSPAAQEAATHQVLDLTGGDDVADQKPPFPGYERLTGDSIMRHVDDTEDVDELRTLLAFEQAHKARKGVLKAAQQRLSDLAGV